LGEARATPEAQRKRADDAEKSIADARKHSQVTSVTQTDINRERAIRQQAESNAATTSARARQAEMQLAKANEQVLQTEKQLAEANGRIAKLSKEVSALHSQLHRKTDKPCEACPDLIIIAPGKFVMGSPDAEPGRHGSEGPQLTSTNACGEARKWQRAGVWGVAPDEIFYGL
jgi:formylglycine-generating enzyme required for sulfatase activity